MVADGRGIAVFDVRDGKERFRERWLDLDKAAGSPELPVFAASGEGQMAVFRLGSPPDNEASIKDGAEETTWLVGVDLSADTPKGKRLRWKLSVPVERPKEAYFSGPPLWYRDKVWIPYQEWRGARLFQGIAALNPETGRWLVKTLIGEAPRLPPGREGVRQPALLTAAGPIIVCCTQAGVIVGVDRASGQVVWGLSYPSAGPWTRLVTPSTRDAAAPVFHLGRVFVAPQDSDLLLCLDAATGRTIWEREVLDIVNLLGCSHGKLIVTTARDLRAFAEATGSDRTGWIVPGEGSLAPLGRGLILGGVVLWPTQDDEAPLRAVSVEEGAPELKAAKGERPVLLGPELLRGLRAGNMAYAHGYLVVAGEKELMVFGPPDAKDGGGKREFPVDREEEPEEVIEGALVVPERKAAAEGAYREEWRIAGKLIPQAGRADAVLVRRAAEVLHVDGRNGTVRWRQKGRGEHAGVAGDMVLLSGPDEVVARKSESGERSWRFENPFGEGRLETLGLSERWLVVTWERRKLFLLDRVTGAARLSVWAPGATALLAGAEGRFQAWVAAMDQGVVVQTGGGTLLRFVEDAAGNIVTTRQEAAPVETPVAFNDGSIVLGQPGGVVERRDLEKRTVRWRFEAKGASSSAAPWLAALGGGVVVVVRRNLGDEVVCLDGAGKPRWRLEWSLFPRGLSTIGAGGDRLFFSHAGRVLCVDGATGTIAWKVELPAEAGAWRFLYHHGLLLVYPAGEARTLPSEMRLFPATTLVWRRHHVIASDDAVFFLLDPVHGRIVQRIQVERGPGPYLTQALPSGFAVSNGRSVTAFLATARK
ncbi:MAG: PQQ-binding-like beta-propeller repeat protein [Gemmataceae bacterium]